MTTMQVRPTPAVAAPAVPAIGEPAATTKPAVRYTFAALRIALGWIFAWAFIDKLFGLGYATPEQGAWINGGQPTKGFLANATSGPFADFYQGFAGAAWADWLFMVGLAGIGFALITGVGMRIAAATGALLMVLMWSAALPPENNPFMDDHLIYAGLLIALAMVKAGDTFGFGKIWGRTALVRSAPFLK
jgi:thiosulfate dehydrogenase [quinone] large subunit